jgi:hypothetical protein
MILNRLARTGTPTNAFETYCGCEAGSRNECNNPVPLWTETAVGRTVRSMSCVLIGLVLVVVLFLLFLSLFVPVLASFAFLFDLAASSEPSLSLCLQYCSILALLLRILLCLSSLVSLAVRCRSSCSAVVRPGTWSLVFSIEVVLTRP